MQYGTRYYLNQATYSQNVIFGQRSASSSYQLSGTTKVFLGDDPYYSPCLCYLQYVRIYWDYVADSQDKMVNLAMMNTEGISLDYLRIDSQFTFTIR